VSDGTRYTDRLRGECAPAWERAVYHRFVRELGADELDDAVFRRYLVQDSAFVDSLAGLVGAAVAHAPDMAARARLTSFLGVLTDEENDYFERALDALDVPDAERTDPERAPPTAAFEDLIGRAAGEGYAETLAVLVPAEWVYLSWASDVEGDPGRFYLREWVDLHDGPEFAATVEWLRGQLDAVGPELSPRRRDRVERHFRRTVELEAAFFDAAYE